MFRLFHVSDVRFLHPLCRHCGPVDPASQLHWPVTASQLPSPFLQSHVCAQSAPQWPASHAAAQTSGQYCVCRSFDDTPDASLTFPAVVSSSARSAGTTPSCRVTESVVLTHTLHLTSLTKVSTRARYQEMKTYVWKGSVTPVYTAPLHQPSPPQLNTTMFDAGCYGNPPTPHTHSFGRVLR